MTEVLYQYIQKLHGTYDIIAQKIEELVEVLNTAHNSDHDGIRALATRINLFLSRLNYSIMVEIKEEKNLHHSIKEFKESINAELVDIKKMEQLVTLAPDHPDAAILTKIRELSAAIEVEMKKQEHIAKTG